MSSKKEAWKQFSEEIQATHVKGETLKSDRIDATFQNWQIVYDNTTYQIGAVTAIYTRLRTPFIAKSDFQFSISAKCFLNKLAKKFGKTNIETGDPRIDDNFVIKSNSVEKVKHLLSNETLISLLLEKVDSDFEISHGYKSVGYQFPKNCDGLSLIVLNANEENGMLVLYYNLFGEILTSLSEAGEIDDAPLDVKL